MIFKICSDWTRTSCLVRGVAIRTMTDNRPVGGGGGDGGGGGGGGGGSGGGGGGSGGGGSGGG